MFMLPLVSSCLCSSLSVMDLFKRRNRHATTSKVMNAASATDKENDMRHIPCTGHDTSSTINSLGS